MKKNSNFVLLTISIIIINFLIFNKVYAIDNYSEKYVIIGNVNIWKYENNKLYDSIIYNGKDKYKVYVNNKYMGIYKIDGIRNYLLYDEKNNKITCDGELFAYSSSLNITNKPFNKQPILNEDIKIINLELNTVINEENLSVNEYIAIDLDNNGIDDKIVNISNLDGQEELDKYLNLIYIELNGIDKQIIIKDEIPSSENLLAPRYSIKYIINKSNSNYDSIIIEKGYFSDVGKTTNLLYKNINNTYEKVIIENEEVLNNNTIENNNDQSEKYILYIFLGIVLLIIMIGYLLFQRIKKKGEVMDD